MSSPKNVIIFVADGLRPDAVNPSDAPTLSKLRQEGVNFINSHSLFPTFTTPNASAIATGHYLGDTGDFSNTIFTGFPVPSSSGGSVTPFIENDAVLADLEERFPGNNFLNEESLLAAARNAGYQTAAVGKLGPILIQDVTQGNRVDGVVPSPTTVILDDATGQADGVPLSPEVKAALVAAGLPIATPGRGANGSSGNNVTAGTAVANAIQQKFFVDATTNAILPLFQQQGEPFALVYWSRDPDGTQHNQGDSLNSLAPGINGPTSKAAIKNADDNLKQLLDYLQANGLAETTDVFVTADHGFSTISKSVIDAQGDLTTSYAASLSYPGVNSGFLPKGFVAIDLAHALNLPLFDPDSLLDPNKPVSAGNVQYAPVDPTKGQLPRFGNGLIGGAGLVADSQTDAKVVVAANGGSDLIYVTNNDPVLARQVVDFLSQQDYVSGIFVDDQALGPIPGTLSLSTIGLQGSAQTPVPSIIVNFTTFSSDPRNPNLSAISIADTSLQQGQGIHGSFGRQDTFNNMVAIGPDFKRGYVDQNPVSNADVAVTLAQVLGLNIPSNGELKGRVLEESLAGGPDGVIYQSGILKSEAAGNGEQTTLNYQQVGNTAYFDAGGYAGRSAGLNVNLLGKTIFGTPGGEQLFAYFQDTVFANAGDDLVDASQGMGGNRLYGGAGKDLLFAGVNDSLFGEDGDDILFAGRGGSTLSGGAGADQFWLANGVLPSTVNVVADFQSGIDLLGLEGLGLSFADLTLKQSGTNTTISALGKDLAVLIGIPASTLGASNFVFG